MKFISDYLCFLLVLVVLAQACAATPQKLLPTSTSGASTGLPNQAPIPDESNGGLLVPSPTPVVVSASEVPPRAASLDQLIFIADTIVRVKPLSTLSEAVETIPSKDGVTPTYRPGMELHFDVVEYFKGDGNSNIIVEVPIARQTFLTPEEAFDLLRLRESAPPHPDDFWESSYPHNAKWDDREAILLLVRQDPVNRLHGSPDSTTTAHYHFASPAIYNGDPTRYPYSVESKNKAWLPANNVVQPGSTSPTFLTDPSPIRNVTELIEISSDDIRSRIESIDKKLAASQDIEGFAECLGMAYGHDAWLRQYEEANGKPYVPGTTETRTESGSPAGTVLDEWSASGQGYIRHWLSGPGADFFEFVIYHNDQDEVIKSDDIDYEGTRTQFLGYTMQFRTARPLSAGTYEMDEYAQAPWFIACDHMPDHPPATSRVTVVPSVPSIHEALFDPVNSGSQTFGAGEGTGLLDPDVFTASDGAETTLNRIDWSSGNVEMQLTPHSLLPDHHIDFIALDGSVSLRLDFDDAEVVTDTDGSQALSWGVCEQPWEKGDKLMIRTSESGSDLTGATNDAECAATTAAP